MRLFAFLFAIGFLAIGVLGYMPNYVTDGNLFGYFETDGMHNLAYIVSGILALLCVASVSAAKWYFRLFGLLFGALAVCGFVFAGDLVMTHVNMADNILHLAIAVVLLYLGFIANSRA